MRPFAPALVVLAGYAAHDFVSPLVAPSKPRLQADLGACGASR